MLICIIYLFFGVALARPNLPLKITVEEVEIVKPAPEGRGCYDSETVVRHPETRQAIRGRKWVDGVVPYVIDSVYSSSTQNTILQAMREIESDTKHGTTYCVRFVPRTNQRDYIFIQRKTGCHSTIGHYSGAQEVSIGAGCEYKGTIMHELNHALGFYHEQERYDRDDFVIIHTDNIPAANQGDFKKHTMADMDTFGSPYDYGSIMHYQPYEFAMDQSKPTISPKPGMARGVAMGQRLALSVHDVERIQKLYGCAVDTTHITVPATSQSIVKCDFEAGLCSLVQDAHDNFDWTRQSGSTATLNTGPNADHTNGGGFYLYAEANGHHNQKARLLTSTMAGGTYCIDIHMFQHGNEMGRFDILVSGPRVNEQLVKGFIGNQENKWSNFKLNLAVPADFHLIFQATVGNGDLSDIAIDDLNVYRGHCL